MGSSLLYFEISSQNAKKKKESQKCVHFNHLGEKNIIRYKKRSVMVLCHWQEVYSELGVQVNWDGFQAVEIQLTKSFQNQTCGLCGDYNQNPDDDWRLGPECDVTGEIVSILNMIAWENLIVFGVLCQLRHKHQVVCTLLNLRVVEFEILLGSTVEAFRV